MEESVIARRIRSIRKERGLTLEEVAGRTGFTKGLLSKIENNKVSPPVSTLVKVAKALGVSLGDFFIQSDSQQLKIVRRDQRVIYCPENLHGAQKIETLVSGFYRQRIEPMIISIEKPEKYEVKLYSHPGQEFIFILEGAMHYIYGDQQHTVSEGDSLYFNSDVDHGPKPMPRQAVKYLSVLCP